jgi:hypothetical protein
LNLAKKQIELAFFQRDFTQEALFWIYYLEELMKSGYTRRAKNTKAIVKNKIAECGKNKNNAKLIIIFEMICSKYVI